MIWLAGQEQEQSGSPTSGSVKSCSLSHNLLFRTSSPQHVLSQRQLLFRDLEEVEDSSEEDSEAESKSGGDFDQDQAFEREVIETFLRCVHQKVSKASPP